MLNWFKCLVAPAAAMALLIMPATVRADSVTFHTVATFTSGGTGATLLNSQQIQENGVGGGIITIAGDITRTETLTPPIPQGTVFATLSATAGNDTAFTGVGVKIDVFQDSTVPGGPTPPNGGTFVGSAIGMLTALPGSSTFIITFQTPLSFTLPTGATTFPPGVIYTVDGPTQTIQFDVAGLGDVRGNVNEVPAVPLPGVALAGYGLFGLIGGKRLLRSRNK